MEDLIAIIFLFGILPVTIVLIWFIIVRARHKERMSLIEKGLDIPYNEKKNSPFQDVLLWGMLAIGTGIGLLLGYLLLEAHILRDDMILGILSILFGGIGLIGYYLIKRKIERK